VIWNRCSIFLKNGSPRTFKTPYRRDSRILFCHEPFQEESDRTDFIRVTRLIYEFERKKLYNIVHNGSVEYSNLSLGVKEKEESPWIQLLQNFPAAALDAYLMICERFVPRICSNGCKTRTTNPRTRCLETVCDCDENCECYIAEACSHRFCSRCKRQTADQGWANTAGEGWSYSWGGFDS
jgi:hypothetical protein